jgi:methionyl-tRNA synthetase
MAVKFEEFKKLDIRIAKVLEVSNHPNADKLYIVKVNWGEGERQLVAGIKNSYTPDALLNKQVVVVTNIEPAVIRGVESQGMLLAASDEKGICVLGLEREVTIGSQVK